MSGEIRPNVLDRVRAEYADLTSRMHQDVMRLIDDAELNWAEKLRVVADLAGAALGDLKDVGALSEPRGLLDMNRHQVDQLVDRGLGLMWLVDQLGMSWATRPEHAHGRRLKIEPPTRIAFLARQLRKVGIHELDELSPPDLMNPGDADDDHGLMKDGKKSRLPRCARCHRPMPLKHLRLTTRGNRCEAMREPAPVLGARPG